MGAPFPRTHRELKHREGKDWHRGQQVIGRPGANEREAKCRNVEVGASLGYGQPGVQT